MEAIIDEGVWSSMSSEEAELMSQLLGNCSLPNDNFVASSSSSSSFPAAFWEPNPNNADAALMYNSSMPYCFSQAIGSGGFPFCSHENYYCTLSNHNNNNNNTKVITESNNEVLLVGKKRSRLTCEIPSSKKSMKCSKGEASSSCSEEESKGGRAPNPNAKTRATRGSATDPQSLYARKRRERINERLRILQTLVPNGTKVDISTMLEEAVQYVKFLQLQIKVLSSDDMWMYAPIAYNGMDIGLDFRSQSL